MEINFLILIAATFVPLVIGFIWYHPKTFGNAWMKASGVTAETAKGANMAVVFGLTILFGFLIAFMMQSLVIHQFGVMGLLSHQEGFNTAGAEANTLFNRIMELYGNSHRTFKHGALHGTLAALFFVTPIMSINALFERKGFGYIAINCGYWIVTLGLMGGLICAFP